MKERMVAVCGLICTECPAFNARRNNDNELRKKTAAEWSKIYGADIKPEQIYCDGCTSSGGIYFSHCAECEMRICAIKKGLQNCSFCEDYPCASLAGFFNMVKEAKEVLDSIRKERSEK